ncbi:hypothetical protein JB92DRAFT_3124701 [Gautieria morchelliformis]|nr:hypothetical protein JB92DRAFT_3124701 [Gautieria morchelliformis]
MAHRLSVDILYAILEHMDQDNPGLARLCRVNRVFKEASESVLYRQIVMPLPAVSRVLVSLASERLAAHVRHFETSKKPGWRPRDSRELLHMRTALRKMTGLRTLRIHFGGPLAWILDGCIFPELRSMLCNLSCDHHLAQFFKRQTRLADVTLSSIHTPHSPCLIDQSCLPSLKQISANPAWLRMLVPYRPVTDIDIWDFTDADTRETGWLSQSSSAVTTLSVSESFLISRGVAHIASLVPELQQLTIDCRTYDIFSDEATEMMQEFTYLILRVLSYFQSLIGIEVRFRGICPDEDMLLRQMVVESSENSLDLHIFSMSFSQLSGELLTKVVWHRFQEEWRRDS